MATSRQVIGYVRVSTEEQAGSGAGLAAQRSAIAQRAEQEGWTLRWVEDAGYSAKNLRRPGITDALVLLKSGQADALVIAKLDRLSRSLIDFVGLMERAKREGWALIALDLGVDTTSPSGEMMANVMASFAQFERRLIGQRTREALSERRAQGVRLGRPASLSGQVVRRIHRARKQGRSLQAIADLLNTDRVPTAQGGRCWWPSTVRAVLRRQEAGAA